MNFEELSLATREPVGELRRWQSLGLLPMEVDAAVDHRPEDRIRLIQFARRRGFQPEQSERSTRRSRRQVLTATSPTRSCRQRD